MVRTTCSKVPFVQWNGTIPNHNAIGYNMIRVYAIYGVKHQRHMLYVARSIMQGRLNLIVCNALPDKARDMICYLVFC